MISRSCPSARSKATWIAGAGIQCGPYLAGKARAHHRRRMLQRAVSSQKFRPIAGKGARRIVHVEERRPVAELGVVRVSRKESAAGQDPFR